MNSQQIVASENYLEKNVKKVAWKIRKYIEMWKLSDIVIIIVLDGGMFFGVDVLRKLQDLDQITVDTVSVSSYSGQERKSTQIQKKWKTSLKDRHVIVLDEFIDSGNTIRDLCQMIQEEFPTAIRTAAMVKKTSSEIQVDFLGFTLLEEYQNEWLYGYGLDNDGKNRHIKTIKIC